MERCELAALHRWSTPAMTDGEASADCEPLCIVKSANARLDDPVHRTSTRTAGNLAMAAGAGVAVVVSAVMLARLIEPVRFTFDEWMFIAVRNRFSVDNVLRSHNGHPSMLPALVYMLGFHTVGLHDQWFYRSALILTHLALCGSLAVLVWRRHGAIVAAAVWLLVCFMGAGATNIVWPFQIGLVGSALFFVLAVGALDRLRESGRTRDAIRCACMVTASVMCSAVGLAALVAIGVVIIVGKNRRRHWWVPVVPLAGWASWWRFYGESSNTTTDFGAILDVIRQSAEMTGAAILSGNDTVGGLLVVTLFVTATLAVARRRIEFHQTVGLVFVATFWILTSSTRAVMLQTLGFPPPARYLYVAVVGLLLAISDLAPPCRSARRTIVVGALCMVIAITSVWAGHADLIRERDLFESFGQKTAAELTVIDAHPEAFADDMALVELLGQPLITIGEYRAASEHLDSKGGLTSAELTDLPSGRAGAAESIMLPLLNVESGQPDACRTTRATALTLTLEPGSTIAFATSGATTMVAARWLPPDPGPGSARDLEEGAWTIMAPYDHLRPAWSIAFDRPVLVLDCA